MRVSGTFLWIIGVLNLLVLVDTLGIFRSMRDGRYDRAQLEPRLLKRGLFGRRLFGRTARIRSAG
jgi:high-affinity nickel-transport protein